MLHYAVHTTTTHVDIYSSCNAEVSKLTDPYYGDVQ